jgi:hypothetical protein
MPATVGGGSGVGIGAGEIGAAVPAGALIRYPSTTRITLLAD